MPARVRVERSRIALLSGAAAFAVLRALGRAAGAASGALPEVTVYKSPTCGCCTEWVAHLRRHGFPVTAEDVAELGPVKARHGVPAALQSCHTALVAGYVVEGHVPADLVERLLRERPKILGVAVPGMPVGSPGMEVPGRPADRYQVLTFDRGGKTGVFAAR
ncbi:MAG TPA: DUF411 domain-containing protein [Methylomirabilota bacterium]|jgi:hypothetical protein|nr:DUF411 domain-containing protein [Methylomirabilota bacterium]